MTKPLGTYSFLPWLRQGLANQIQSPDFTESVRVRAQVNVQLELRGDGVGGGTQTSPPINRQVALFGPGDIVGIETRAIVRTEPRNWITNFEPNYLPAIEFYDEDFPWRYTPAAPQEPEKKRLRPWIMLLVLSKEKNEYKEGTNLIGKPLPYIEVPDLNVFPRPDELWAWAHVHVNESLAANDAEFVSTDMNSVIPKFENVLARNPDLAYSRIVCPRKLDKNTAYDAFLIPVFEAGRRAGLGLDIGNISATRSAWEAGVTEFPYYYRWFFRTGTSGDFETLVRLLVPKPVDPRVGTREMDVLDPGSNVAGLDKPELGGILRLGGALLAPSKVPPEPPDKFETWDDPFPRPLQQTLADLINRADDLNVAGHPDPIITAPLYGTWHALTKRVLKERDGTPITPAENWVHRLNLDPRFRVAAGFGTRVIQDNQEKYVDAAWEQIGRVLDAQRRIRWGQFGVMVSDIWFDRHLSPLLAVSQQKALLLMAPLNKRVLTERVTVHHAFSGSFVQPPMTSAALRRIIRPRGRLIRALPFDETRPLDQLLIRVNNEEQISAAPPKVAPPGVVTIDKVADLVAPADAPSFVIDWLRRFPQLPLVILLLAIFIALILVLLLPGIFGIGLAMAILTAGIYFNRRLRNWGRALGASDSIREANQTPASIDNLPAASDFRITEPGSGFVPDLGGADSLEATRFKTALRDSFTLIKATAIVGAIPTKANLDLTRIATASIDTIKPTQTIPTRVLAGIFVPPGILGDLIVQPTASFVEPMAYPIIDQPMYEPLAARSSELFLPNINLIEMNSITLLEQNQRFIESYMVGLNHEFARELLWREYPTDQRGSTFRQFWDVRSFFNLENLNDDDLKESLRDIPPLHTWAKNTDENPNPEKLKLGSHDNRQQGPVVRKRLVLVLRGELLKRYPTAVIYAHRACWQRKKVTPADETMDDNPCGRSGPIDNTQERRLAPLTAAEEDNPPRDKVQTPLFEAKVDPDIYFFGFDLTAKEAIGGTGENEKDDPGWFFVIKERPGEPRFGLDTSGQPELNVWNDLAWTNLPLTAPGNYIQISTAPDSFPLIPPGVADNEKNQQHQDDKKVVWSHDMSSAELAYILWQAPVLVAVHASEMLPKQ